MGLPICFYPERARSATPEGPSQEREVTPEIDDGKEKLSMSIEETNRLRAKLGLKPLQADSEEKKDDENKEVFVRTENISEKKEAEAFRDKIRTLRKKQEIKRRYEKVSYITVRLLYALFFLCDLNQYKIVLFYFRHIY